MALATARTKYGRMCPKNDSLNAHGERPSEGEREERGNLTSTRLSGRGMLSSDIDPRIKEKGMRQLIQESSLPTAEKPPSRLLTKYRKKRREGPRPARPKEAKWFMRQRHVARPPIKGTNREISQKDPKTNQRDHENAHRAQRRDFDETRE